ncbi:expressed unknown protein [Seminavis robusta]|uniref:Homeobox domain-containing protein n=1 Tax=Seminavis robusta TaxID=568900 RepID=A0A9N8HBB0_9STRA|nr:expressed unknown protein [Seminavis robusta]|eukprot:Sro355_g124950.1 n/a (417) ;mRNA; r:7632-8882
MRETVLPRPPLAALKQPKLKLPQNLDSSNVVKHTMAQIIQHNDDMTNSASSSSSLSMMPELLLPTVTSSFDCHSQSSQDQHGKHASSGSRLEWNGSNPLEWIESIAAAAETRASIANGGKVAAPIRVNGVNLSLKRPMHYKLTRKVAGVEDEEEPYNLKDDSDQRKRSRVPAGHATAAANQQDALKQGPWDLTELLNDEMQPKSLVHSLHYVVLTFESKDKASRFVQSSYQRIRSHFEAELHRIKGMHVARGPCKANIASQMAMLGVLYNETQVKMEALIRMEEAETQKRPDAATTAHTVAKKDFTNFMSAWLRDNWTNPYPDDDGLIELADACSSTPTVISNWLINARTRKWRPAIVKAFDMKRPSELLLEDSLNIFDGNPVREIPQELEQHHSAGAGCEDDHCQQVNKRAKTSY